MDEIILEVPVRMCCGQRHWSLICPDGLVMCCICFERFEVSDLFVDVDGDRWNMCAGCGPNAMGERS